MSQLFATRAGVVLAELARRGEGAEAQAADTAAADSVSETDLLRANSSLHSAADAWLAWVGGKSGGHPKASQPSSQLVTEYLELSHRGLMRQSRWVDWRPGVEWDLSITAQLPRALRERCEAAPAGSPFMSVCR